MIILNFGMAFNIESALLTVALKQLEPQYKLIDPDFKGKLDIGHTITFIVIQGGTDRGKLTIAQLENGKLVPHPSIIPVDYANLIKPGEDLATAVNRIYGMPANSEIYASIISKMNQV